MVSHWKMKKKRVMGFNKQNLSPSQKRISFLTFKKCSIIRNVLANHNDFFCEFLNLDFRCCKKVTKNIYAGWARLRTEDLKFCGLQFIQKLSLMDLFQQFWKLIKKILLAQIFNWKKSTSSPPLHTHTNKGDVSLHDTHELGVASTTNKIYRFEKKWPSFASADTRAL